MVTLAAYGRADAKRMVTPWSLFRIGSVSKVVTALGILRLHDEGLVSLDAKVFGPKGQYPDSLFRP